MVGSEPSSGLNFVSSRYSGGGNCVEVARGAEGVVVVQDSKDRGRHLSFTPMEWRAFMRGVKAGEFDHFA